MIMKKKLTAILLSLAILAATVCACASPVAGGAQDSTELVRASASGYDSGYEILYQYFYDKDGNLVLETQKEMFHGDESEASTTTIAYAYNSEGILEQVTTTREGFSLGNGTTVKYYDSHGNLTQADNITYENEYDDQDRLVKCTERASDQTVISDTVYTYESDGSYIKEYIENSNIFNVITYYYNADGILIRAHYVYGDMEDTVEYDEHGNIVKSIHTEPAPSEHEYVATEYENTYNEDGVLTLVCRYMLDPDANTRTLDQITTYLYDDAGRLLNTTITTPGSGYIYETWEYDSAGNLTKYTEGTYRGIVTEISYTHLPLEYALYKE